MNQEQASATKRAVGAGGVPEADAGQNRVWFVAIVQHRQEMNIAERIGKMGIETYVPAQMHTSVWKDGRRRITRRLVIPSMLFVHATEAERQFVLKAGLVNSFLTNRAKPKNQFDRFPAAVVPDSEMNTLKFMLYNAQKPVEFDQVPIHIGDRFRVLRGALKGMEGVVVSEPDGKSRIHVDIQAIGSVSVEIDTESIEIINQED